MRLVTLAPLQTEKLSVTPEQKMSLGSWLSSEVADSQASRFRLESVWRRCLRNYEGIPRNPTRDDPIVNAPNTVVTFGAIATDVIYAQILNLVYSTSPVVTVRPTNGQSEDTVARAKGIQRFIDRVVMVESDFQEASKNAVLDDVKMGTGVFYIPWMETVVKKKMMTVRDAGPRMIAVPIEDFFLAAGPYSNIQTAEWVGARFYLTAGELNERSKLRGWDIEGLSVSGDTGWVRHTREVMGHNETTQRRTGDIYQIFDLYVHYDIDGDGICEDLYVVWDRSSQKVLYVDYNPFTMRPFEVMRYQIRSHLLHGLGVMEMLEQYQEELTEIHNHRVVNMMLANARLWKARRGTVPENLKIWPNKVIELDDPASLQGEQLGDVYPSALQAEQATIVLSERRVGMSEISNQGSPGVFGTRTPGITALSYLQQASRRFTHTFEEVKKAHANAAVQLLYRYHERLAYGDEVLEDEITKELGFEDGSLVIDTLKQGDFSKQILVEITASSESQNKGADQQSLLAIMQILGTYYERMLQLHALLEQPTTTPMLKTVIEKIIVSAGEAMERTLRTFEVVRDPESFIVSLEEAVNESLGSVPATEQGILAELLGSLGGGEAQPNAEVLPGA